MLGFRWPSFLVTALLSCHSPLDTAERTTTNFFFFSSHFHPFFPLFLWSHGLYLSFIVSISQIRRPLVRNKTAIDIRIESCDLLRLFEVKDYIKNTKREIDLAFGDLIEILGIGIILVQLLWIFIRMLVWYTVFAVWESKPILMKIYITSMGKKARIFASNSLLSLWELKI